MYTYFRVTISTIIQINKRVLTLFSNCREKSHLLLFPSLSLTHNCRSLFCFPKKKSIRGIKKLNDKFLKMFFKSNTKHHRLHFCKFKKNNISFKYRSWQLHVTNSVRICDLFPYLLPPREKIPRLRNFRNFPFDNVAQRYGNSVSTKIRFGSVFWSEPRPKSLFVARILFNIH